MDDEPCDLRPKSNSFPESRARGFRGCATTSTSVNGSSSAYRSGFGSRVLCGPVVGEADTVFVVSSSRMERSVFVAAEDGVTSIGESTGFQKGGGDFDRQGVPSGVTQITRL